MQSEFPAGVRQCGRMRCDDDCASMITDTAALYELYNMGRQLRAHMKEGGPAAAFWFAMVSEAGFEPAHPVYGH